VHHTEPHDWTPQGRCAVRLLVYLNHHSPLENTTYLVHTRITTCPVHRASSLICATSPGTAAQGSFPPARHGRMTVPLRGT
jgi:hypothetical protein